MRGSGYGEGISTSSCWGIMVFALTTQSPSISSAAAAGVSGYNRLRLARSSAVQNFRVKINVIVGHALRGEIFLGVGPDCCPRKREVSRTLSKFLHRITDVSAHTVFYHFPDRSAGQRQDRCAASHGFHHHKAKRLVPLNREQHGE